MAIRPSQQYRSLKSKLENWDTFELSPESTNATVYVEWESLLQKAIHKLAVPEKAQKYMKMIPTKRLTDWLVTPPPFFGSKPIAKSRFIIDCVFQASS